MSLAEDISKLADAPDVDRRTDRKKTLLQKYRIPIQHFEYDYIEKCKDARELENILHVLRSGEEGHYPDLIRFTEERLNVINPKSKLLRACCTVLEKSSLQKDEVEELTSDLQYWLTNISKKDQELDNRKCRSIHSDAEVRTFKESREPKKDSKERRIKSTDYSAWDKYDPDTELLKMELSEKKGIEEAKKEEKPKKKVSFNRFATEAEATFFSEREREKGNEFFKSGDYEEALQCYNDSIAAKANVFNINNRAAVNLKLKRYNDVLSDCETVLKLDKENLKAQLRKAEALENMERYDEALRTVEHIIEGDPNNRRAQETAQRLREKCPNFGRKTRMKIIEIE
ncbi:unnamed protein product [Acanthoscelides obtectus]|uniref:Sperm-associated antigen 1 n=1 Tax=Acanthoscelides obtectus TaxID=200917 RepID=A0A9P0M9H3_ACAOB|nr:unnamed protein product [Acanthoscelides obtectus]CAK1659504.1 Sperm-associated antigen 1 [Acanthoscelides obtectus]